MKYIVDRIEGNCAICEAEDRSMIDISISELPHGIKEGDHLSYEGGKYSILPADDQRIKRIQNLMEDLWN